MKSNPYIVHQTSYIFNMPNTFLTAEWRKLIMVNYAIDPQILKKYLPEKTELDLYNGLCYVSLIGFMFLKTKLKGIPIPFHSNFEEVNLRFYVKHKDKEGNDKRGVVFIREIVPKFALSLIANIVYNEPYATMPMKHKWTETTDDLFVEYAWRKNKQCYTMNVVADNKPSEMDVDSEEAFVTEHYWGYNKSKTGKTTEYGVEHPSWQVYKIKSFDVKVDFEDLYGADFSILNTQKPVSVLLAEGSEIVVKDGEILRG
jgi:uncharacterized protein